MARNTLEIHLDRIRNNYSTLSGAISPLEVMAVLKANGYGLGAEVVGKTLREQGCRKFGVADLNEALLIKEKDSTVYILGDLLPEEIPGVVANNIVAPVTSFQQAQKINNEAQNQGKKAAVHFLIDTGMGRLGIPQKNATEEIKRCASLTSLTFRGIYSHFPFAYGDKEFSEKQIADFLLILKNLKKERVSFPEIHVANSDGVHNIPASLQEPFNLVRVGINLYGCFDLEGERTMELQQAVTLKSRLVSVRELPEGATVGYGRTYTLKDKLRVGTVAIGYADGMPLALSNRGHFLIRGIKCPILGRVSMDYTTVDLSRVPDAIAGDEVICLSDDLPVREWAVLNQTITYDIICSIGNRVKRVYLDN